MAFVSSFRPRRVLIAPLPGLATLAALLPGLLACLAVSMAALAAQAIEQRLFGRAWLESLVLAILLGTVVRGVWTPSATWRAGIAFGAKPVLEAAIVLLGASVSAATLFSVGGLLLLGIVAIVFLAILVSFSLGRLFGLSRRMALLVACGNAICGNSAIAAVAPVIGAEGEDVTAAIAFTALLGVATVLGLPLLGAALHLGAFRFGVLSGLTVYAVPQVLAATAAAGTAAVQIGTLVKLGRVLMLGPVCFTAALLARRWAAEEGVSTRAAAPTRRVKLFTLIPWFIIGFLGLAAVRSLGLLPAGVVHVSAQASGLLTVVSMAALGLCTDLRCVAKAGPRAAATVTLSLVSLGAMGLGLIYLVTQR